MGMLRAVAVVILAGLFMSFANPAVKLSLRDIRSAERLLYKCFISTGDSCGAAVGHLLTSCITLLRVLNVSPGMEVRIPDSCRCFEEAGLKEAEGTKAAGFKLGFCVFQSRLKQEGINLPDDIRPEVVR